MLRMLHSVMLQGAWSTVNCLERCQWHHYSYIESRRDLPGGSLIASSRNLLAPNAFHGRHTIKPVDAHLSALARKHGLELSQGTLKAPLANHCLAASLQFAKKFRTSGNLAQAADAMRHGVDLEVARATAIYERLFAGNRDRTEEFGAEGCLERIQQVASQLFDLSISKRMTLNYPLQEVLPYLENSLPAGEYLISLNNHVVTLIKHNDGQLSVYDPDMGTMALSDAESKKWFLDLLRKHKVDVKEELHLLQLSSEPCDASTTTRIRFSEPAAQLRFSEQEGRWGTAQFTWRGKTHHFVRDQETGYLYNNDSPRLLRFKCFLLTPRIWIDTALRTIHHLAMAAFHTLKIPFILCQGKARFLLQIKKISSYMTEAVRAPVYGLLCCGAALYGMFKPFEGRRLFGLFERSLNNQNLRVDFRERHYVAPCFKPWNFGLQHDQEATISALKSTILRLESLRKIPAVELFCGWRRALPCF